MKYIGYFFLGKAVKKFSFRGELLIKINGYSTDLFLKETILFFEIQGALVAYSILRARPHKTDLLRISLEGIIDDKTAGPLINKAVYLDNKRLPAQSISRLYPTQLIGFHVIEKDTYIGVIQDYYDLKTQPVLEILSKEEEILIPLHKDFIVKLDETSRQIHVDLPDGLLELNHRVSAKT